MKANVEFNPTPEEMAELLWNMSCDDQAEMLNHLGDISEGRLMMQGMYLRDECIERKDNSLQAFQDLFSSAFTHFVLGDIR